MTSIREKIVLLFSVVVAALMSFFVVPFVLRLLGIWLATFLRTHVGPFIF